MPESPPYMNAYGNITKILDKVKAAKTPDKFTQDFLGTVLGFTGGGAMPFIPFAKRLGLLQSDGTPTPGYRSFRNSASSGQAMAQALRRGYADLYKRNEFVHEMDGDDLRGLVMEGTGLEKGSERLRAIVQSFLNVRAYVDFSEILIPAESEGEGDDSTADPTENSGSISPKFSGVGFSNTVYLNLPNTTDPAVFNAIFKSFRENFPQ